MYDELQSGSRLLYKFGKRTEQKHKFDAVKKIVILMLLIFLAFSMRGFSQEKSAKKPLPEKTEQVNKVSTRSGSRPKKPLKKRIHRRGTMRHGNKVKM